jgi:hypothetical protein
MLTRRSLFDILAGAVAAPIVAKVGLLQTTSLVQPKLAITLEDFIAQYMQPAMDRMVEQIERDLFMYGTAMRRDTYDPATGKIVSERIDPALTFLDYGIAA